MLTPVSFQRLATISPSVICGVSTITTSNVACHQPCGDTLPRNHDRPVMSATDWVVGVEPMLSGGGVPVVGKVKSLLAE